MERTKKITTGRCDNHMFRHKVESYFRVLALLPEKCFLRINRLLCLWAVIRSCLAASVSDMQVDAGYLVKVTTLYDLLREEGREYPEQTVEQREIRLPDECGMGMETSFEHLVSLGLTWEKLEGPINEDWLIWMGRDTYLRQYDWFPELRPPGFRPLMEIDTHHYSHAASPKGGHSCSLCVYGKNPVAHTYVFMMNLLAELVGLDETIRLVELRRYFLEPVLHFPTSAMQRLLVKSSSRRSLSLPSGVSTELSQVLFSGVIDDDTELNIGCKSFIDSGAALIQALRANLCPPNLYYIDVHGLPETVFEQLTVAIRINKSVKKLQFLRCDDCLRDLSDERMTTFLKALTSKQGLRSLEFNRFVLNNKLWQLFWIGVADNNCLRRISFLGPVTDLDDADKAYRTNCVVVALQRNKILKDVQYSGESEVVKRKLVLPLLRRNELELEWAQYNEECRYWGGDET